MKNKLFIFLLVGFIALVSVLLVALSLYVSTYQDLARYRSLALNDAQLQRLLADQVHIAQSGLFPDTPRQHDAGVLLNPLTPLHDAERYPVEQDAWWDAPEVVSIMSSAVWHESPEDMPQGDFSLMKALLEYDHWDLSSSGPYADYIRSGDMLHVPYHSNSPNPIHLQNLAKLRLAQGLHSKDMIPALQEVRHLSRLTYSTHHDNVHTAVAVSLLAAERFGYDAAVDRNIIAPSDWQPIDSDTYNRLRRVSAAMALIFFEPEGQGGYTTLRESGVALFGECSAIAQQVSLSMLFHLIPSRWPLEQDYGNLEGPLIIAMEQTQCHFPTVRQAFESREEQHNTETLCVAIPSGACNIPYLRGRDLVRVVMQENHFTPYGATSEEDSQWSVIPTE